MVPAGTRSEHSASAHSASPDPRSGSPRPSHVLHFGDVAFGLHRQVRHGQAPWPGRHPVSRAGRWGHLSRARAGPLVSGYGCVSLSSPRPVGTSGPGWQGVLILFGDRFFKGRYEPAPHGGVTRRCARGGIFRGLARGTMCRRADRLARRCRRGSRSGGPVRRSGTRARGPARLEQFQQSGPTAAPAANRRRSSLLLRKSFPEDLYAGSAFYAVGAAWTICLARPEPVIRIAPNVSLVSFVHSFDNVWFGTLSETYDC